MSRLVALCRIGGSTGVCIEPRACSGGTSRRTFAVIMTNDPVSNQIKVYNTSTRVLLQTLSTAGRAVLGGNARGVKQYKGELFAAVNNGSNTVALYTREGDGLKFDKLVTTTSAPVSVDFGNDHMYVAGATTVDSFALHGNNVGVEGWHDLAGIGRGRPSPERQHGASRRGTDRHVLVTLKIRPDRAASTSSRLTMGP